MAVGGEQCGSTLQAIIASNTVATVVITHFVLVSLTVIIGIVRRVGISSLAFRLCARLWSEYMLVGTTGAILFNQYGSAPLFLRAAARLFPNEIFQKPDRATGERRVMWVFHFPKNQKSPFELWATTNEMRMLKEASPFEQSTTLGMIWPDSSNPREKVDSQILSFIQSSSAHDTQHVYRSRVPKKSAAYSLCCCVIKCTRRKKPARISIENTDRAATVCYRSSNVPVQNYAPRSRNVPVKVHCRQCDREREPRKLCKVCCDVKDVAIETMLEEELTRKQDINTQSCQKKLRNSDETVPDLSSLAHVMMFP